MKKKLLVFAHRAEAQIFIENLELKAVPTSPEGPKFQGVYEGTKEILFILGEGPINALTKLSSFLGIHHKKIDTIINFGIAGVFQTTESIKLGSIIPIKTILCYFENIQFHTFEVQTPHAKDELVTVHRRQLDLEQKSVLCPLANVVDREAWGLAKASQFFQKPLFVYKLISDQIGENQNFCEEAKILSQEYSFKMFAFYQSLNSQEQPVPETHDFAHYSQILGLGDDFYFTTSQKSSFLALMKRISQNENTFKSLKGFLNTDAIKSLEIRPKEKSKLLIQGIKEFQNPHMTKIQKKLNSLLDPHQRNDFKLSYSSDLEEATLNIHLKVSSPSEVEIINQRVKELPLDELQEIFKGNYDL
ncbi:MAG: hypothetical protein ACPGJV_00800 [Bacteriovoracaceae bacterium]